MPRYIDAERLIQSIQFMNAMCPNEFVCVDIATLVEEQPTADVVEIKHEEWAHLGGDEWCCTGCGYVISTEGSWEHPHKRGHDFCKHCGAKMDGGKDNDD